MGWWHARVTFGATISPGCCTAPSPWYSAALSAISESFHGALSPVVGWLIHEFHSISFGFAFAGLLSLGPLTAFGNRYVTPWLERSGL